MKETGGGQHTRKGRGTSPHPVRWWSSRNTTPTMLSCSLITTMARFDPEPGYPTRPFPLVRVTATMTHSWGYRSLLCFILTLLGGVTFYPNGKSQTDTLTPHCRGALVPRGSAPVPQHRPPQAGPSPSWGYGRWEELAGMAAPGPKARITQASGTMKGEAEAEF